MLTQKEKHLERMIRQGTKIKKNEQEHNKEKEKVRLEKTKMK